MEITSIFKHPDVQFFPKADLTKYSTFEMSSFGDLYKIFSLEGLLSILEFLKRKNLSYFILGNGSNVIFPENFVIPVLKLCFKTELVHLHEKHLEEGETDWLNCNTLLNKLTAMAIKYNLLGWEAFTGIPATLGGAIYMNAGTSLGSIGPLVRSLKIYRKKSHSIEEYVPQKQDFAYRKNFILEEGDIFLQAKLQYKEASPDAPLQSKVIQNYLKFRNETQPMNQKSCGCLFKNPLNRPPAGKILEDLGLKGFEYKGFQLSQKHANYLVNNSSQVLTRENLRKFIQIIQGKVKQNLGINLELEVILL